MQLRDFLRDEDMCSTIKTEIMPLIKVQDFEEMYVEGGRPPISPKLLTVVTLLQFLEGLSDRAAAFNLRFRIDWKIALGLEVSDEGIHHSSLSRFRDRLVASEKASYAFDKILAHLVTLKLVKPQGKQRIDSTHVIGKVRELTRLELLWETLRLFCREAGMYRTKMKSMVKMFEKYNEERSTYRLSEAERASEIAAAGFAMREIIAWLGGGRSLKCIASLESYKTLKTVFEQNFKESGPDGSGSPVLIPIATGKNHICSPHEPEARFANKGGKGWLGYKAQIAETVPEVAAEKNVGTNIPNFITYAEVSDATDFDGDVVAEYISEQEDHGVLPANVYGDTHYNTEANIEDLAEKGTELRGSVIPLPAKETTKEKNRGFQVDVKKKQIICPNGKRSVRFAHHTQGKVYATFGKEDCLRCPCRERCKPRPRGKTIFVRIGSETLNKRRAEMETDAFKKEMYQRNGIEGTLSGLVRGQRLRNARYRGKAKMSFQIKFSAATANIKRLHRYFEKSRVV